MFRLALRLSRPGCDALTICCTGAFRAKLRWLTGVVLGYGAVEKEAYASVEEKAQTSEIKVGCANRRLGTRAFVAAGGTQVVFLSGSAWDLT